MVELKQAALSVNYTMVQMEASNLVAHINEKREGRPVLLYTTAAKLANYGGLSEPLLLISASTEA